MKLREVRAQNIRNFGPDALPVSFVDEATGQVRALTVLVGSNGSGKTTLLELIHKAMEFAAYRRHIFANYLVHAGAALSMSLQVSSKPSEQPIHLEYIRDETTDVQALVTDAYGAWADYMKRASEAMAEGGILSFPADRFLPVQSKPVVSRPKSSHAWLYSYDPSGRWEGSLEQLWVWQNYLDLEANEAGRPSLLPFVTTIEEILGRGQTIKIKAGEVWIERPQSGDRVRPHELPSGEQQVLLLFGEILRRLRPGAIVMIDELEMNLHPGLQRVVIHHLRRLAQKHDLQIIVTTHSLEIVAACDPSEIVNLDDMVFAEQARTATEAQ